MSKKGTKRSEEDKLARAFCEGAKRAYGKIFWRWLDSRRNGASASAFSSEVLKVSSSTYSRGLSEGKICLENLIHLLLELGLTMREAPDLPDKRVLQTMGFQHAMATRRQISLIDLCFAQVLMFGPTKNNEKPLWQLFNERVRNSPDEEARKAWKTVREKFEVMITNRARDLVEKYYQAFPEERPPTPTHYRRDCALVWEEFGSDVRAITMTLYNLSWVGNHE